MFYKCFTMFIYCEFHNVLQVFHAVLLLFHDFGKGLEVGCIY